MISKKFDPELFERAQLNHAKGDEIKTESLNFWQDAFRRLRQNKPSIISLYAIILLVVVSFLDQNTQMEMLFVMIKLQSLLKNRLALQLKKVV